MVTNLSQEALIYERLAGKKEPSTNEKHIYVTLLNPNFPLAKIFFLRSSNLMLMHLQDTRQVHIIFYELSFSRHLGEI